MSTPKVSGRFAGLKAQAEHLADIWPRVIFRYRILKAFTTDPELSDLLTPSRAAHTHNALIDVLTLDLLRELAAIVLDNGKGVISLRRLLHFLSDPSVEADLRREYVVVPPPARLYDEGELSPSQQEEIQKNWTDHRRAENLKEFERLKAEVAHIPASVFKTEVAERVEKARNNAVAHYAIVTNGTDWRSFELKEAGIRLGALDAFVTECTRAMETVALFVRRAGVDYSDFAETDDKYAAEYVEAVIIGRRAQRRRERLIRRRLRSTAGDLAGELLNQKLK